MESISSNRNAIMDHTVSQLKLLERHTTGISFLNDIKGCLDILSEYLGAMGYALITFQPTSSRQPAQHRRRSTTIAQ